MAATKTHRQVIKNKQSPLNNQHSARQGNLPKKHNHILSRAHAQKYNETKSRPVIIPAETPNISITVLYIFLALVS